jgi:ankyrin repeat protein
MVDFVVVSKPARFFVLGRVFKVLWTEPASPNASTTDQPFLSEVSHGQRSFTKFRRFVVLRGRLRSSLCLALHTYTGQGALKNDVRAEDHAIVFDQSRSHPVPLPGEAINIDPFPLIFEHLGEQIDLTSRLDFGRIYTIEHNIRVMSIGRISPEHLERLDRCFMEISIGTPTHKPTADLLQGSLAQVPSTPVWVSPATSQVPSNLGIDSNLVEFKPRDADLKAAPRTRDKIQGKPQTRTAEPSMRQLDPQYGVRNRDYKTFFRPGRVFSTLWTTPYSGHPEVASNETPYPQNVTHVIYGEQVHSKIRRFVVVRASNYFCTCLPITPYDPRGRKDLELGNLGLIYNHKKPRDIDGIDKQPLKVILSKGAEKLGDMALVDYARIYTIEMNIKVRDVGQLDPQSEQLLKLYFKCSNLTDPDDLPTKIMPKQPQESCSTGLRGAHKSFSEPNQGFFTQASTPGLATYQPLYSFPVEYNDHHPSPGKLSNKDPSPHMGALSILDTASSPEVPEGEPIALQAAAREGRVETVLELLNKGADPNERDAISGKGGTALQEAVQWGHMEVVEILLLRGADIHSSGSKQGWTTLQIAIRENDLEMVKLLLDHGADVNFLPSKQQQTALQAAVGGGNLKMVQTLLEAGANVDAQLSRSSSTVLKSATETGYIDIIKCLLACKADPDDAVFEGGRTALQIAIESGSIDIVGLLLACGADPNKSMSEGGRTALQIALESGFIDIAKLLLKFGADPNKSVPEGGRTALQIAAGLREVADLLLLHNSSHRVKPSSSEGKTAKRPHTDQRPSLNDEASENILDQPNSQWYSGNASFSAVTYPGSVPLVQRCEIPHCEKIPIRELVDGKILCKYHSLEHKLNTRLGQPIRKPASAPMYTSPYDSAPNVRAEPRYQSSSHVDNQYYGYVPDNRASRGSQSDHQSYSGNSHLPFGAYSSPMPISTQDSTRGFGARAGDHSKPPDNIPFERYATNNKRQRVETDPRRDGAWSSYRDPQDTRKNGG